MEIPAQPDDKVLAAFGASSPVDHISSGQGTTWLAVNMVLKPLDMTPDALYWQAEIIRSFTGREDLGLAAPIAARDGSLIVDGWTAWDRLDGAMSEHAGKWDDIIATGDPLL